MKTKRVKDPELLSIVRSEPCLVCFSQGRKQVYKTEPDHVTTRGAGGGDTDNNVWPLCQMCHAERHRIGIHTFIQKYDVLYQWLKKKNRYDVLQKLWLHKDEIHH